jgi:hypothetical protein
MKSMTVISSRKLTQQNKMGVSVRLLINQKNKTSAKYTVSFDPLKLTHRKEVVRNVWYKMVGQNQRPKICTGKFEI